MASHIQCHIVSAQEELFAGDVEFIVAAGELGDLGITKNHTPLLTSLKPGSVKLTLAGGDEQIFYISGGFLEVQPGKVTILADSASRGGEIDEAAALEAQKEALQAMNDRNGEVDYAKAAMRLAEAAAQLSTLKKIRQKHGSK